MSSTSHNVEQFLQKQIECFWKILTRIYVQKGALRNIFHDLEELHRAMKTMPTENFQLNI